LGARSVTLGAVLAQERLDFREGILGRGSGLGVKRRDADQAGQQRDEGACGQKSVTIRQGPRSKIRLAYYLICTTNLGSCAYSRIESPGKDKRKGRRDNAKISRRLCPRARPSGRPLRRDGGGCAARPCPWRRGRGPTAARGSPRGRRRAC